MGEENDDPLSIVAFFKTYVVLSCGLTLLRLPEESHRIDVKKESLVTGRISQYLMTPVPRMECGGV